MKCELWATLLTLIVTGAARGGYDAAPGPAPGGSSSWVWRTLNGGDRWSGGASLGRPAEVEGLAWTHAWCGTRIARVRLTAEAFGLRLEELYQEELVGIWIASRGVGIGLRHWQTSWEGGPRCGGWTGSLEGTAHLRRLAARFVVQDLALGRVHQAGPRCAAAAEISHRIAATVEIAGAIRREHEANLFAWRVRWTPAPAVTLTEELWTPGAFGTGVEFRVARLRAGLWVAPVDAIGARTGASLAWGNSH